MGFVSIAFAVLTGLSLSGLETAQEPFRADAPGVTLRLLTQPPNADGRIRGAIAIDLQPGWKTYWSTPGGVGLAPSFVFQLPPGTEEPELHFPTPTRLSEEGASFNGYDEPMAVAFETAAPAEGSLDVEVLIGVCETVCVPVAARLSRDPEQAANVADSNAVDRAFLRLPAPSAAVLSGRVEDGDLIVRDENGAAGELFLSANRDGWDFGVARNENDAWRIPILRRPGGATDAPTRFDAVLDDGAQARHILVTID